MGKFSIRFTVVSIFVFMAFLLVLVMFYFQFKFSTQLAKDAAHNEFKLLSTRLNEKLSSIDQTNFAYIDTFTSYLQEQKIQDIIKNKNKYLEIYSSFLSKYNNLYALYLGDEKDYFFEIIKLKDNKNYLKEYKVKENDEWLMIEIKNKAEKNISIFDKNLNLTSQETIISDYKSSQRPWYKKAKQSNGKTVKTRPYELESINKKAITYTKYFNEGTVFSISILTDDFSDILEQNLSINLSSYIIDSDKNIIAKTDFHNDAVLDNILKDIKLSEFDTISNIKSINDEKFIFNVLPFGVGHLVSFAKLENITKPYKDEFTAMILLVMIVLLIISPFVLFLSSFIVRPIVELCEENEKIKNRNFQNVKKINSNVTEISQLSDSLHDMAKSIKYHQKELEEEVEQRTKELQDRNLELKLLSVTDKLTGTYNRIKIDECLENEAKRYNRYDHAFGIIIIDIDFFKKVNDTYGHQAGDKVLQEFANLIKENIRKTDVLGRWGGEEFVVICIEIDKQNLLVLAEKLKNKIQEYDFYKAGRKTASFGVTMYRKKEKIENFIKRADTALYEAKKTGRNKVIYI